MNQEAAMSEGEIVAIRLAMMALCSTHPDPKALVQSFTSYLDQYTKHLAELGGDPELIKAIRNHVDSLMEYIPSIGA